MQTLSAELRRSLVTAVTTYQNDLAADTAAQAYLMKRGLGPEAAASFHLGVVRRPIQGHEAYVGRLAIPYITPAGPVNIAFRCLKAHDHGAVGCPKYLRPAGTESNLFNVLDLRKPGPLVVCEGEIDTITWSMCGVAAVGLSGVKAWKSHFKLCLEDFERIYSAADADEAGQGLHSLLVKEVGAVPLRLPQGMDSNDLYLKEGADALRRLLKG